jgi:hypothetical protein
MMIAVSTLSEEIGLLVSLARFGGVARAILEFVQSSANSWTGR